MRIVDTRLGCTKNRYVEVSPFLKQAMPLVYAIVAVPVCR